MLTVNPDIGVPTWLKLAEEIPSWEQKAYEFVAKMNQQKNLRKPGSQDAKDPTVEDLKQLGNNFFQDKRYLQAQSMYGCALHLARGLADFDVVKKSQLYSNMALCWLRLDCPQECMQSSREAVRLNGRNTKAHHHLASSLFMLYKFKEALQEVESILKINPECIELLVLKEKILLFNGITHNFTQNVVKRRLEKYEGAVYPASPCVLYLEKALIEFDKNSDQFSFLMGAEIVISNKIFMIDTQIKAKNFHLAYNELVGLHHIYHVKRMKYDEAEDTLTIYDLYFKKALCLYYLEKYKDALDNCDLAKELIPKSSVELLTLESKILCKLKRFKEASELIKNLIKDVSAKGVEDLILKEISFMIDFEQSKTQTNIPRIHPSTSSEVALVSKGTASDNRSRESSSANKIKTNVYHCPLCIVDVLGPKVAWNEHLKGKKHKALAEFLGGCGEEINQVVRALTSSTSKEHLDEDSDDYQSAQSDFENNRSELDQKLISISKAAPSDKVEVNKCLDSVSERAGDALPSNVDSAARSKPNEIAKKSEKSTNQDQKLKQTTSQRSKSKQKKKATVKHCHVCNVQVGSTKEAWIEHSKGKIHAKLHEEREARRAALKKELEEMEDEDDSDNVSEECQDSLERSCSSSEKVCSLIGSEDVSEEVHDSDFSSQNTEESDNNRNLIKDKKLKVSEDSWTYPNVKIMKRAKSSKTNQKPARRKYRSRKSSKNSISSGTAAEEILVECNDVGACGNSNFEGQLVECNDGARGNLAHMDYLDDLGELQLITDDGCSEAEKWEEVKTDQNKNLGENKESKERSFIIKLPPNCVFPLKLHDYSVGLACEACLQKPGGCSNCRENVLVVQKKPDGKWIAIRERTGHGQFYSQYRICRNIIPCYRGSICSFPHSEEEQIFWNMEKQKRFSIWKFIKSHRSKSAPELNGIESICNAFPGLLKFVCGECYLKEKSIIGKTENSLYCSNRNGKHNWTKCAIMIHENNFNGPMTPIFPHSKYKNVESICQDGKYCNKKGEKCLKAHSLLEQQIWRFQEENKCSGLEFAEKFNELNSTRRQATPNYLPSQNPPHVVKKICSVCWSVRNVSYENPQNGRCTGIAAHPWKYDHLFYIPKAKQQMRNLPRIIPRASEFRICWNVQKEKPCKVENCQFAHCQEELDIWKWMVKSGNHDLGLVAKKFETPANKPSAETKVEEGTFVSRRPQNAWNVSQLQKVEPFKIQKEEKHYCPFCEKCFSGARDLEVHRNTQKHMENVKSDACMQWNHRIPPYASKFELCKDHSRGKCYYSNVPDECNYCTFAHGQTELEEWNERLRWKKVKFDSAGRDHLLSAASKFIKAYHEAEVKSDIVVDHVEGIKITFNGEHAFRSTEKNCQHLWLFEIKSERPLKEVYLLKEHGRKNFSLLQELDGKEKQYVPGALIRPNGDTEYEVYLKFQSKMFGCFSQTVIFDFGGFPVVFKTVKCEVGSRDHLAKLDTIRLNLNLHRWTPLHENIIRYEEFNDKSMADLSSKYPTKDVDEIMSDHPVTVPLHKDIYRRKMHGLLYLEELSQTVIISRYNLKTTVELCNMLESKVGGLQVCSEGELFGRMSLENEVIEGSLMLKSVRKVLFKPLEGNCQNIFEAVIPEFEDNPQKNITGESVTILFHKKCIEQLNLKAGEQLKAEVQFQLDRDSFCKMHYAIDNCILEFLCPTLQSTEARRGLALKNPELNEKQNKVLTHAFTQGTDFQPPMVVYGPFGTGKTETLARTSVMLATQRREMKILICTKSNMTADEYFKRYFCATNAEQLKVIRIYNTDRKMTTVDLQVKQFCLIDQNKGRFRMPTMADIKNNQIIVATLEVSFYLHPFGNGCGFSHIFIDEAGQDLECRTIIPFVLADKKTQIVVVGDHMQMGEELFSQVARDQNFGLSLMERLLHHYGKLKKFREPPQIFFTENYRNHKDIVAFVSKIYYENALVSKCANVECASMLGPLEFFTVLGKEESNKENASFYNLAEVEEIVERVAALYEQWPAEWGERCASQILVTSPYMEQIRYIRRGLRMKARGLGSITVVRAQNAPGLEFRAVFVSSVRTSGKVLSYPHETGCKDEGFLTQPKLLNSIFTRAKSYLAVVGDPITLCSTGECSKIWIEFLRKCQELNKINPPDLTLQEIKDACSSRDYDIDQDDIENGEAIDDFEDAAWKEGFKLKSDEIIKQLVLEYSSEEVCGFSLSLLESLENGQNNISTNFLNYISLNNAQKNWQSSSCSEVANIHRCLIRMRGAHTVVAKPFEPLKFEILIPTRKLCNTALDGDEVLVRIVNSEDIDNPDKVIKGEVVEMLKRRIDIEDRKFVCYVDEQNRDIMIPINKKIPLIKIVTSDYAKKTKEHVSVYGLANSKKLLRDVPVNCGNQHLQLFLVKLLRWEKQYGLPLGVVISVMKPGTNMPDIAKILDIEYDIPERLGPRPSYPPLDPLGDYNRVDCTDLLVFTIDGEKTEDIDDAVGFEVLGTDSIVLSIHISDVSFYISAKSPLDEEARQRTTSFYPPGDPIHMLPENYSIDICSLKEGMKRRALSIFMKLDGQGNLGNENDVWIKRTFIKSKDRLTYEEVESVLMDDDDDRLRNRHPRQLIHALKEIHKITTKWRWERLGSDSMEWKTDLFAMDGPNSRELIAELMIQANKTIAQFLLKKFQNCTPLRIQIPPDQLEMDKWKEEFSTIASKSTGLRRFFKSFPDVCMCEGICSCIDAPQRGNILVPKKLWNEIVLALETQNPSSLRPLVHDLDKLPQAVVANSFLKKIQECSEYVCSGDVGRVQEFHYSLNTEAYTHFTSPIRRYIDIVVHRLVIDGIENRQPSLAREEISEICRHCTYMSQVSREYDKAWQRALLCTSIQDHPLRMDATVTKINRDFEIELHSMAWHAAFRTQLSLKPDKLGLTKLPELIRSPEESALLSWEQRIYNNLPMFPRSCNNKNFNSSRLLKSVNRADWELVMHATIQENLEDEGHPHFNREPVDNEDIELSSEGNLTKSHFCTISMKLQQCDLITVQVLSKLHRGLLTPFVQMVPITTLTNVCIEHNSDPVKCFSRIPSKMASKSKYASLSEYKQLWRSVLSLEAAQTSVDEGVPAIIHNVPIEWGFDEPQNEILGSFQLDRYFCKERGLMYFADEDRNELQDVLAARSRNYSCSAYICIQYHGVVLGTDDVSPKMRNVLRQSHPATLAFHCLVLKATLVQGSALIQFDFKLKHHSSRLTNEVKESMARERATVEWMEQSLPMRRMFGSLEKCPFSELASKIVLAQFIPRSVSSPDVALTWRDNPPNSIQEDAIKMALNSSFSLIQGPPGTGKTFVVAQLVNQFYILNMNSDYKVMCCGPSNKSADVIATALLKLNPNMEILRIYGESKENKCYPLPVLTSFVKEKVQLQDEKTDESLRDYTLHHLIRNERKCVYARNLLRLEEALRQYSKIEIRSVSEGGDDKNRESFEEMLGRYRNLKRDAEKLFIEKAKVIITTCTGVGAGKLKECFIKQLLIDECGMCTEPESLVPMVGTSASQIVLIGDHKQLRPIITNKVAAKLGLETSLFERYNERAFMLTKQYRMHEAISEFPSNQFYEGRLTTGKEIQRQPSLFDFWPGGRHRPIAFVHLGGSEESLVSSTEEGGLQSKKNTEQAHLAIKIAFNLVHHYQVNEKDIIILSQYRSQCTEISRLLRTRNLDNVSVSTVISAQGSERKFVILSTVRTMPRSEIERNPSRSWKMKHLGFVIDPHQINVALTRAELGLIILGNKELLSVDRMWKDLIDHYQERNALVTVHEFALVRR